MKWIGLYPSDIDEGKETIWICDECGQRVTLRNTYLGLVCRCGQEMRKSTEKGLYES